MSKVKINGIYRGRKYNDSVSNCTCEIYNYNESVVIVHWLDGIDIGKYGAFTTYKFLRQFALVGGEKEFDTAQTTKRTKYQKRKLNYEYNTNEIRKYIFKCFDRFVNYRDKITFTLGKGNYWYIKYKNSTMAVVLQGKTYVDIYVKKHNLLPKTFSLNTKILLTSTSVFNIMYKFFKLETKDRETINLIANDLVYSYSKVDI